MAPSVPLALDRGDAAIFDVTTAAPGPAGQLPLTPDDLLQKPSGDLFGWSLDVGMGWAPGALRQPQMLLLSTLGGMREPDGTFPTPEAHEAAIQQVIAAGKKVNCPTGIHAMEPHDALRRAEQGMRFIAVGSELRFMSQQAQAVLEVIKPQKEQKDVVRY